MRQWRHEFSAPIHACSGGAMIGRLRTRALYSLRVFCLRHMAGPGRDGKRCEMCEATVVSAGNHLNTLVEPIAAETSEHKVRICLI